MGRLREFRPGNGISYADGSTRTSESQPLSDKNSKKYQQREDRSAQERLLTEYENPITVTDVETLRSIGRKSVNDFTSEDIQKSGKWAHKFYQELGTKSPFFRAWFGDWRVADSTKVRIATIPEYVATNEARKANRGNVINADTGWNIRISREGETNTISHAGDLRLSEYGLSGIRELIENAVLLDSEVHEHHSNNAKIDRIAFYHKLYALGLERNNNIALYKITIEEAYHDSKHTNEKAFHNLKYIEKVASVGGRTAGQSLPGVSTNDNNATVFSVSQLSSFVKRYDKDFSVGNEVNPALLNTDGTPKVLHHQTDEDITVFDIGREGAGASDNQTPFGIFLKSTDTDIGISAQRYSRKKAQRFRL